MTCTRRTNMFLQHQNPSFLKYHTKIRNKITLQESVQKIEIEREGEIQRGNENYIRCVDNLSHREKGRVREAGRLFSRDEFVALRTHQRQVYGGLSDRRDISFVRVGGACTPQKRVITSAVHTIRAFLALKLDFPDIDQTYRIASSINNRRKADLCKIFCIIL